MPELYFTDDADLQLVTLESDQGSKNLLAAVTERLAWLEADATDVRVRRDRFQSRRWVSPVHTAHDAWVILWEAHEDGALVVYVGDDFR